MEKLKIFSEVIQTRACSYISALHFSLKALSFLPFPIFLVTFFIKKPGKCYNKYQII